MMPPKEGSESENQPCKPALFMVHVSEMAEGPRPQRIPLIFYRTQTGNEPVREWLKGLDEVERHAIGKDLLAGAMAVAGGHAAMPADRQWLVGNPDGPADQKDGARADLPLPRALDRPARVHQEDAVNAG